MGHGANASLRAVAGLLGLHLTFSYSNDYFRFGRATRGGGGLGLQTSVTRFTEGTTKDLPPVAVDLYSMTHVAESRYYEQIARDLEEKYDCVLYELIVPEHVTVSE